MRGLTSEAPTVALTPDTHPMTLQLPTWNPTSRLERTRQALHASRDALGQALDELELRHPHDRALMARVAAWRVTGGVPFRG